MIVFMYFPVKHKSSFPFLKECHSTQLFSFCFCATTFSNLCFTWINSNDLFSNVMHLSWFSKLTWDLSILAIQANAMEMHLVVCNVILCYGQG